MNHLPKILAIAWLLMFSILITKAEDYQDVNGLVVIEAENLSGQTSNWKKETSFTPFTGASYIRWNGSDNFSSPGIGVISASIKINNPGVYRVLLRNKVGHGSSTTEANDTWVKFPGVTEFYGKKGTRKVYPKGSGKTPNPEGASKNGWLKVYSHGTTAWTWRAKTNDKDPYDVFVEFDEVGEYTLSLSGRSKHHCVDRVVLFKSDVSFNYATDLARTETLAEEQPVSRIAILADGNSPDPDDIGATAVSLAILRAMGAEERLVYYAHSCDLVRNNTKISPEMELQRQSMMQNSCDGTAEKWGGFDHITFYNCRTQQTLATDKLRNAINKSTELSPLVIIEAGEPDVIYDAIEAADSAKRQFVSIITHHVANDESADDPNKNLSNILADFSEVSEVRIPDQNVNLQTPIEEWDWAKNHPDERITWLYSQGKLAEEDPVVGFQKGKFDCSDAGMVYYHLTGEETPTLIMLKELFNAYVGFAFEPHLVPGKIQFEDYDFGGNEEGYLDKSEQDLSQYSYRNLDLVDLGRNGTVVTHIEAGEWLNYTVNVQQTGFYNLSVNHSTTEVPGVVAFHVTQLNKNDTLISSVECLYTGRSTYYSDNVGQIFLSKGEQVLRFSLLNSGVSLDYMVLEFVSPPLHLNVTATENGHVSIEPAKEVYAKGDVLTLTAVPDEGFKFINWGGDYQEEVNPLSITFGVTDVNVEASFQMLSSKNTPKIESLKVYPNPNNGQFLIILPEDYAAKYILYGLDGELLIKGDFVTGTRIRLDNLNRGAYLLRVLSKEGVGVKRIIIQ